jgi:hypothetical protein
MKFIITESKYEKIKNNIKKSVDEFGLVETLSRYKLPIESLDYLLEKEDGDYFSAKQLSHILVYYSLLIESLPNIFNIDSYEIFLEDLSGHHRYISCDLAVIKNKNGGSSKFTVAGFFDPFLLDNSYNVFSSVSFNWFTMGEWTLADDTYKEVDSYDKSYVFDPPKISSIKELKDWYLNVVPQEIIKYTEMFIDYVLKNEGF